MVFARGWGWGNLGLLFNATNLELVEKLSPGDLMHGMIIIVNNTIL